MRLVSASAEDESKNAGRSGQSTGDGFVVYELSKPTDRARDRRTRRLWTLKNLLGRERDGKEEWATR